MAEINESLEELKAVKQAFKNNINANDISTADVEFRNMPELLKQMEKKLPNQTKSVEPTKYSQIVKADDGYRLEAVGVREIPSQYIIPSGTKEITENNEYDVTEYSKVRVEVANSGTGIGGNPKFSKLIDGSIESVEETDLTEPNKIKDYTFYYCMNLTSVVIPGNIASIGASAFEGCSSLQTLVIADGVQSIGASAFKGINASVINIPTTVSVLESEVFANNTALTSITIPANITEIKDNAFYGCNSLTEITMESLIPPTVTDISFPTSVTSIYVPYSAYESYLGQWVAYSDKIVRLPAIPSTITVTVNNYLGDLVGGAEVTITGNEQTYVGITDTSGVFVQGDLQPATYTISVADLDGFKTPTAIEVVVEEDTQNSVTVTYLEKPAISQVFGENTPEQIAQVSAVISANNMTSAEVEATYGWKIGDTINIPLTTGENIEMRIIGFNHDDLSDGTGKAGITLQMTHCLPTLSTMTTLWSSGGWQTCNVRTTYLPSIKTKLPTDWQNAIKTVDKKSANGGGEYYSSIVTTSDDLFLLALGEIRYDVWASGQGLEGSKYAYWSQFSGGVPDYPNFIMQRDADGDGIVDTNVGWWTRSASNYSDKTWCYIKNSGESYYYACNSNAGVSFAFCI